MKIDEGCPDQSVENPLLVRLWFEIRIRMKGNLFQFSLLSPVLKNKCFWNDSQHLLHFLRVFVMLFFKGRLGCRIFQQATMPLFFIFELRGCGWVAVDCQQMFNGGVNRFDHLFENYVVVFMTL